MSFLDKINEVVESVTNKSEEIIETNKIRLRIGQLKGKRRERFYLLGKDYYELSQDDEFTPEKVEGLLLDIGNIEKDIVELENKLKQLQEEGVVKVKPLCSNCGEDLPIGARYCPKCGKAFVDVESIVEEPIIEEQAPKE
jgi:ribosomal protein S27AE